MFISLFQSTAYHRIIFLPHLESVRRFDVLMFLYSVYAYLKITQRKKVLNQSFKLVSAHILTLPNLLWMLSPFPALAK